MYLASVCVMVQIKDPLLLIGKKGLEVIAVDIVLLSEWSLTICQMSYNCK